VNYLIYPILVITFLLTDISAAEKSSIVIFRSLGSLDKCHQSSKAFKISGDGLKIFGTSKTCDGVRRFVWSESSGIKQSANFNRDDFRTKVISSFKHINVVVASKKSKDNNKDQFLIDEENNKQYLKNINRNYFITSISDDGHYLAGYTIDTNKNTNPFIWNRTRGINWLHNIQQYSSKVTIADLSENGFYVVGNRKTGNAKEAFIWNKLEGMKGLGDLDGGRFNSIARDISADGTTVVGTSSSDNSFHEAFIWNKNKGMQGLGDLPNSYFISDANSVSGDGSIVVGKGDGGEFITEAFIWNRKDGMQNIKSMLIKQYSLDLEGWQLYSATDISNDGSTIVGMGFNPDGKNEAWMVKISRY